MRAICNNLSSLVLEAVHNYWQKEQTEGDLLEPSSSISYHGFGCQVIDQQQSNEKECADIQTTLSRPTMHNSEIEQRTVHHTNRPTMSVHKCAQG